MLKDAVVKILDGPVTEGANILIPVDISDVSAESVTAYGLIVQCDPDILAFTGVQEQGTLTEGWMEADNDHINGYSPHAMNVEAAVATPAISRPGTLVFLKAKVLQSNDSTTVRIAGLTLNETVLVENQVVIKAVPVVPSPEIVQPTNAEILGAINEIANRLDALKK
jgi:hypothetical protein